MDNTQYGAVVISLAVVTMILLSMQLIAVIGYFKESETSLTNELKLSRPHEDHLQIIQNKQFWASVWSVVGYIGFFMLWVFSYGYATDDWSSLSETGVAGAWAILLGTPAVVIWTTAYVMRRYVLALRQNGKKLVGRVGSKRLATNESALVDTGA